MSSGAVRYAPRYSVGDYAQWSGEWELWSGVAVSMSPSPTPLHQLVSTNLAGEIRDQLRQNAECRCVVVCETDWHVDQETVVRPDVSVLCNGLPEKHIDYPPALIAEVLSQSTELKDRNAKRDLYQQQNVRFYLIVNPATKSMEVLELLEGSYARLAPDGGILRLSLDNDCRLEIDSASIFPL